MPNFKNWNGRFWVILKHCENGRIWTDWMIWTKSSKLDNINKIGPYEQNRTTWTKLDNNDKNKQKLDKIDKTGKMICWTAMLNLLPENGTSVKSFPFGFVMHRLPSCFLFEDSFIAISGQFWYKEHIVLFTLDLLQRDDVRRVMSNFV